MGAQIAAHEPMSPRANIYLQCILGTGVFLLISGLTQFETNDLPQFFAYLFAAMLSATWKFKVPGIPANYSALFAFILVGIANFSLGEALAIGCPATLVQCLWRAKERRSPRKVLFSVAVVAIGITVAYNPPHFLLSQGLQYAPRMISLAALVYFLVNTALVSGMVALVWEEPCLPVWKRIVRHSGYYYLAGGVIATLIIVANRLWGWQFGLSIVPLLYLTYRYYRFYLAKRDGAAVL
jgi:hypothetical protein